MAGGASYCHLRSYNSQTAFGAQSNVYLTLKPSSLYDSPADELTTTWDYTTLKLGGSPSPKVGGLLPLGITLLSNSVLRRPLTVQVLLPLGITLLSNNRMTANGGRNVLLPLGITLLSNLSVRLACWKTVLLPLGITLLSNGLWHGYPGRSVLLPLGITLLSNLRPCRTR